jgi:hypothetical protein
VDQGLVQLLRHLDVRRTVEFRQDRGGELDNHLGTVLHIGVDVVSGHDPGHVHAVDDHFSGIQAQLLDLDVILGHALAHFSVGVHDFACLVHLSQVSG